MLSKNFTRIFNTTNFFFRFSNYASKDTIFSLATGGQKSAISIVRVSGPDATKALALLEKNLSIDEIYKMPRGLLLKKNNIKAHKSHLREFYEVQPQENRGAKLLLDKSLMIFFPKPKSFTGEDIVEFHIHGGRAMQNKFLSELKQLPGFRIAQAGEFTKRAFFNNKLDLLEVEGLADLISAETECQRQQSIKQFTGDTSRLLFEWRGELMSCLAHCEAFIDFESDEEDVQADVYEKTSKRVEQVRTQIKRSLEDKNKGEIIREGFRISIIGPPNAGKSSLLNILAKRDVAIVSEVPGTTRDVLTVSLNVSGFQVIINDTAGLRESTDNLENEGIKRSLKAAESSNAIVLLLDSEELEFDPTKNAFTLKNYEENSRFFEQILREHKANILLVINKSDKITQDADMLKDLEKKHFLFGAFLLKASTAISCVSESNIDVLLSKIEQQINNELEFNSSDSSALITRARHRQELQNCFEHLENFLTKKLPIDLAGEELRCAVNCLGRITGRIDVEEILDILFKDFCIGK